MIKLDGKKARRTDSAWDDFAQVGTSIEKLRLETGRRLATYLSTHVGHFDGWMTYLGLVRIGC